MSKQGNQLKNKVILKKPLITEKATSLQTRKAPAYIFAVDKSATKEEVKKAFKAKYQKDSVKVNMINISGRQVLKRGKKKSSKPAVRKAIIFLKAGEKIET